MALDREFRVSVAVLALRCLEEVGATLDDVLNGEVGKLWVEESCGGDRELAAEAFEFVYPGEASAAVPGWAILVRASHRSHEI